MVRKWFAAVVVALMVVMGLGACSVPDSSRMDELIAKLQKLDPTKQTKLRYHLANVKARRFWAAWSDDEVIFKSKCFNLDQVAADDPAFDESKVDQDEVYLVQTAMKWGTEVMLTNNQWIYWLSQLWHLPPIAVAYLSIDWMEGDYKDQQDDPTRWRCSNVAVEEGYRLSGWAKGLPEDLNPKRMTLEDLADYLLSPEVVIPQVIAIIGSLEWKAIARILCKADQVSACDDMPNPSPLPSPPDGPDPGSP